MRVSATGTRTFTEHAVDDPSFVLAPGTSLGGARPKATVRDGNGNLMVAKFPKKDDDWPVTLWEAVVLALAEKAGVLVPTWRLEMIAKKPVVLLTRFDLVDGDKRIPFMSAMTAIDATDHADQRSYLELVDALRQMGSETNVTVAENGYGDAAGSDSAGLARQPGSPAEGRGAGVAIGHQDRRAVVGRAHQVERAELPAQGP
jgi:serine/threonine-protein kinase HipA